VAQRDDGRDGAMTTFTHDPERNPVQPPGSQVAGRAARQQCADRGWGHDSFHHGLHRFWRDCCGVMVSWTFTVKNGGSALTTS
jgi:hypothetical protein